MGQPGESRSFQTVAVNPMFIGGLNELRGEIKLLARTIAARNGANPQ